MLESNMRCFEQKYEKDNKIIIIGGKSDEDEKQSRIGTDDVQKGTYCRYDFLQIQRF